MHLINSTWLSFTLFILIEIVRDFSQDYHFGTKKVPETARAQLLIL